MKRRHFLQLAASTLATLGVSHVALQQQGLRYARVLAQPTPRKRALLVGINQYSNSDRFTDLKGCVTDVEMQRELLIHRFGFHSNDIVTLTDADASRRNILEHFEEFLINPCQADDVIVFHYSGHGRRIADPDNSIRVETGEIDPLNSTLVSSDDGAIAEDGTVSDIMGRSLFLLTSALSTENVTMVLDSCYSGGGIRGNTRVRSAGERLDLQPSEEELDFQERWLNDPRVGAGRDEILRRREIGIAKGIAIAAARRNQKAIDAQFDGFYAGAFTYFLTQFLWHEVESVENIIANVTRNLQTAEFNQVPLGCVAPLECGTTPRGLQTIPIYHVESQATDRAPAEAVIQAVDGDRATIWLGGSDANSITTYTTDAQFRPVGQPDAEPIIVVNRNGLTADVRLPADGQLSTNLAPGTLLQESARIVPRNIPLRIGLDSSLANESADAQAAFEGLGDRFQLVLPQADGTYEGEVQAILSRMTQNYQQFLREANVQPPALNTIVLLSPSIDQVVPGSVQDGEGAIAPIIANLSSTLNALYAARFIKSAINTHSTQVSGRQSNRLRVDVRVEQLQADGTPVGPDRVDGVIELPLGAVYQFVVTNREAEPLYLSILEVDQAGDVKPLFPNQYTASVSEAVIQKDVPKTIPDPRSGIEFFIEHPVRAEFLVMVSRRSPRQALIALRNEQRSSNIPVVDALLADMSGVELNRSIAQQLSLSTSDFAAFSISFRGV